MAKKTRRKSTTVPETRLPAPSNRPEGPGDWLWIPLRNEWRDVTGRPEELVRQDFILHLHNNYGYTFEQMDQERRTMHGHRSPRADIVIWETPEAKARNMTPVLVVECKAEKVDINIKDYYQGESYTRAVGCEFFIAHNARYTSVFKLIPGVPGESVPINEIAKATDWGDAKRIDEIRNKLRAFNRREFQDLLFKCHSILRDVHKMDPGRAFDTISKILFVKMYVERSGLHGTFSVDYLDRRASTRLPDDLLVHEGLFKATKEYYEADDLFAVSDRLEISEATFRRIVKELQRFDLSKTGDDIKGLAFERFLGSTFRGELGQFFTPRPVVDFMVNLLDPREGELICDPAAGSGGFLIRAFEHVRGQIASAIQIQKETAKAEIEAKGLRPEDEEARIDTAFATLNRELLASGDGNKPVDTRVGRLAWRCIFGCDAEPRAARTAKMNMIMHGDGHGGIHHHDGLVDTNGIFPTRFDVVMTNPPFGSNVGNDQKVDGGGETRIHKDDTYRAACLERYGDAWEQSHRRMLDAAGTNILDLFEIGKSKANRATEIIFVERCLSLLKPGGRMGIVLPDGNLNNPSLSWLRRWCEGKARILAVVSLPEETFRSADATVKASLVFFRRFTAADEAVWEAAWTEATGAMTTPSTPSAMPFAPISGAGALPERAAGSRRSSTSWPCSASSGRRPLGVWGRRPTILAASVRPGWPTRAGAGPQATGSAPPGSSGTTRSPSMSTRTRNGARTPFSVSCGRVCGPWTKRTTPLCGSRCVRCSTILSSPPHPAPSASHRPARQARTCRTIFRSSLPPGVLSSRGSRRGPSRKTRRIFVCPLLPDPAVEGARTLDRC